MIVSTICRVLVGTVILCSFVVVVFFVLCVSSFVWCRGGVRACARAKGGTREREGATRARVRICSGCLSCVVVSVVVVVCLFGM